MSRTENFLSVYHYLLPIFCACARVSLAWGDVVAFCSLAGDLVTLGLGLSKCLYIQANLLH
jgi:hypothetical protein